MAEELGRLLDPKALDVAEGARARLAIEVPSDWLAVAVRVRVVAPRKLSCARCDGGGCDGCGRSGIVNAPDDPSARALEASLPRRTTGGGFALRLVEPFGASAGITQLFLEVRVSERASANVERLFDDGPHDGPQDEEALPRGDTSVPPKRASLVWGWVAIALALGTAVVAAVVHR
jgi:hypothetical protein